MIYFAGNLRWERIVVEFIDKIVIELLQIYHSIIVDYLLLIFNYVSFII